MGMVRTLYFCLSSLDKGADMSVLLICEGAVKCLFLFLLLDAVTSLLNFIFGFCFYYLKLHVKKIKQASIYRLCVNIRFYYSNINNTAKVINGLKKILNRTTISQNYNCDIYFKLKDDSRFN